MVTTGIWVASVGLAIFISDLGTVLGLTGSVGASALAYLFPAMLYIKFYKDEMILSFRKLFDSKYSDMMTFKNKVKIVKDLFIPVAMLIFTVISMVAGAVSSII